MLGLSLVNMISGLNNLATDIHRILENHFLSSQCILKQIFPLSSEIQFFSITILFIYLRMCENINTQVFGRYSRGYKQISCIYTT